MKLKFLFAVSVIMFTKVLCSESSSSEEVFTYYIAAPVDKYFNTLYPPCVIKTVPNRDSSVEHSVIVLEPKSFVDSWPSVCSNVFIKCEGPSCEKKSFKEYVFFLDALIKSERWKPTESTIQKLTATIGEFSKQH